MHKDRIQYVVIKNYSILDKRYINMVLKPLFVDIKSKYIIIIKRDIVIIDDKDKFIKEISNVLKYGTIDTKTIKEILR